MTIRKSKEQLLADIRKRLSEGYIEATAERIKRIAARESDPEILRGLVGIACDALTAPPVKKPRKRPPAKKLVVTKEGVADLDSTPPMTEREQLRYLKEQARDHVIFEQVAEREGKLTITGAIAQVARIRKEKEPEVRKAYYKIKKRHSPKV